MRLATLFVVVLTLTGCSRSTPRVVLFCAQDREFAEGLLAEVRRGSGLEVLPKFDTEADKSVSLYIELLRDRERPRCDVFWNNEILSTIRLQKQGLLEPYASPSGRTLPAWARAGDHTWHAFAERARVLIVNTALVPERERPTSLFDLTQARFKGRAVMARPQHGTSATQAACLFATLGADEARSYYRALKTNEVQIAPGNKQVAEWVAKGKTPDGRAVVVGVTDTDDAIGEVEAGRPVAIVFPDQQKNGRGTLFIPNTVALIRNGPNLDGGRKLIDFLLTPEVERRLAEGESRQFPLHEGVTVTLPTALNAGRTARRMVVDFERAAANWEATQTFLRQEFATAP